MTSWYAVGVGIVVLFVGNVVGILLPGFGQLGAALLGGGAAGYVAGGNVRGGIWHGFLTGLLPGLAVVVATIVAILLLDFAFRPVGMLAGMVGLSSAGSFFTVGAFAGVLLLTLGGYSLVSGIGGIVGGALSDR